MGIMKAENCVDESEATKAGQCFIHSGINWLWGGEYDLSKEAKSAYLGALLPPAEL